MGCRRDVSNSRAAEDLLSLDPRGGRCYGRGRGWEARGFVVRIMFMIWKEGRGRLWDWQRGEDYHNRGNTDNRRKPGSGGGLGKRLMR